MSFFSQPFWARGFRPFFLLGALYAVISLLIWGGFYTGHFPSPHSDPVAWHAHEMIYGFAMAIVAGFLLTAVPNWTGTAPVSHRRLAGLGLLWLAGRIAINLEELPFELTIALEGAFIPALAVCLSIPLLKTRNARNFVFIGLLAVLFACDIAFMLTGDYTPLYGALFMIVAMISLLGGRVIPAFTVTVLRRKGMDVRMHDQGALDKIAVLSLAATAIALFAAGPSSAAVCVLAFFSAFIHLLRLRRYHTIPAFHDPMLWILHMGYLWLIAGLVLTGLSAGFGIGTFPVALHAFTAGSIGSMTLGMMSRVTLGHTGREITCLKPVLVSFILMQAAAVLRVFGPLFMPEHSIGWIVSSAALWSACFAIYLGVHASMMWSPRVDGQPA
jgi:uncharacterized protein involved in response to NO